MGTEPREIIAAMAPRADWSHMTQGDHFAQFYDSDAFLLSSLASFVSAGLSAGDAVVIVATNSHLTDLHLLLETQGVDVGYAIARSQYVALTAAETLSSMMI